jgi:hypothetical protein
VVDPAYLGTYVSTREFHAPDEEPAQDMAGLMDVEMGMFEIENL